MASHEPFRETIGQKTSIANEIRRNLDNYTSSQILGELLQNADDAGAIQVGYMLDKRQHGQNKVYGTDTEPGHMADLQGPALLMYDSAVFKEEDWKGLLAFGQGSKELDPTKTGKFGLGFNSVYHLTEVPSFVSGEYWMALDPQCRFVPGITLSNPGLRTKPSTEVYSTLADQFEPFSVPKFGCDLRQHKSYEGTLFRFPLRTPEQAKTSTLRPRQSFTPDDVERLFADFIKNAEHSMLFLNHVRSVEVFVWDEGATAPRLLKKVVMSGTSGGLDQRGLLSAELKKQLDAWSLKTQLPWKDTKGSLWEMMQVTKPKTFPRTTTKVTIEVFASETTRESWCEWWIRQGVGKHKAWRVATKPESKLATLWPAAAIAVPVRQSKSVHGPIKGMAFATLPIDEVHTGYPIHVNASWCLSDNRTSLITSTAECTKTKSAFNRALLEDVVSSLWAEVLVELRNTDIAVSTYYNLWPSDESTVIREKTWELVVDPTIRALACEDVLCVRTPHAKLWENQLMPAGHVEFRDWKNVSNAFFDELITTPTMSSPREERVAWLSMILRDEAIETSKAFQFKFLSRLTSPSSSSSSSSSSPLSSSIITDKPVRLTSKPALLLTGSNRFRLVARRVLNWIKMRGNIPEALLQEQCPWLLATPLSILHQFERTAARSKKLIQDADPKALATSAARCAHPQDVRQFYRTINRSTNRTTENAMNHGDTLATSRFPSLRGSSANVTGLLRYCVSDLTVANAGAELNGLPFLLLADETLTTFGVGNTWPVLAADDFHAVLRLFRGHEHHVVGAAVSTILRPWVDAPPQVLQSLHLVRFNVASLTRVLHSHLKSTNQQESALSMIAWDTSQLDPEWSRALFSFLKKKENEELGVNTKTQTKTTPQTTTQTTTQLKPNPLAGLEKWHLLPVTLATENLLLRCDCANMVLRLPCGPDGTEVEALSGRGLEISRIVQQLGIAMLQPGFSVPNNVGVPSFGPKGILEVVTRFNQRDLNWSSFSNSDRYTLLKYFDAADIDKDDLELIRKLPLFEVDVNTTTSSSSSSMPSPSSSSPPSSTFISLEGLTQAPRQLPIGFNGMDLEGVFFKSMVTVAPSLYAQLGIKELERTEMYTQYIFPRFPSFSDNTRIAHMLKVADEWHILFLLDVDFESICRDLSFVRLTNGPLARATDAVDPSNPVFREFFPERIPSIEMRTLLPFLRHLGMQSGFSRDLFLKCARTAAAQQDVRRAKALVDYLFDRESLDMLANVDNAKKDQSIKAFYKELSTLKIVRAVDMKLPVAYDASRTLWAFNELAVPEHFLMRDNRSSQVCDLHLVWSVKPVLHLTAGKYINAKLREALGISITSTKEVLQNLLNITRAGQHAIERVSAVWGSRWFLECLSNIYSFLEDEARQHGDEIKNVLENETCILHQPSGYEVFGGGDRHWRFVAPKSIFINSRVETIPGYCHHVSGCPYVLNERLTLVKLLGARDRPSVVDICAWLQAMAQQHGLQPLSQTAFNAAVKLLNILADLKPSEDVLTHVMAPDSTQVLRPCPQLVVLDAPWLNGRINADNLHISHPRLKSCAQLLGIKGVGSAVEERLEEGFRPTVVEQGAAPYIEPWKAVLQTVQFRNGIKQILYHELLSTPQPDVRQQASDDDDGDGSNEDDTNVLSQALIARVHQLSSISVIGVESIRSCFVLKSTGQNITKTAQGSAFLVQETFENNTNTVHIYITVTSRLKCLSMLTLAVNQFMQKRLKNLQPVEKILDCAPDEVSEMLSFLQIPEAPSSFSDYLGLDVESSVLSRLRVADDVVDLHSGREIAWQSKPGDAFKYGRVSRVAHGTVEVETSNNEAQQIPKTEVRLIFTVAEVQEEMRATAEQVKQRVTSAQQLDIDVFGESVEDDDNDDNEDNASEGGGSAPVERQEYTPPDRDWEEKENGLLNTLKEKNQHLVNTLEEEPLGIDELLVQGGFSVPSKADKDLASKVDVEVGTNVRRGYDLVRWGNIEEVAFFHAREEDFTPQRQQLAQSLVTILREVSSVFDYDCAYVTMFYQKKALSRFITQKLMFNIWPIEVYMAANNISDIFSDPFAYMYFYGLHIHKLAHFHDVVHGTRHNFFMNEIRIEFLSEWIELLEAKGFDPAALETSDLGTRMLKSVVY